MTAEETMSIVDKVNELLSSSGIPDKQNRQELIEAERLADLYSDVKPVPFIIPIERLIGSPALSQNSKNTKLMQRKLSR